MTVNIPPSNTFSQGNLLLLSSLLSPPLTLQVLDLLSCTDPVRITVTLSPDSPVLSEVLSSLQALVMKYPQWPTSAPAPLLS